MIKKLLRGLALSAGLLTTLPAQAWWDTGHMVTAQIAFEQLTPAARQEAERLIALLNPLETVPARRHFVPAAVWMDEIKARQLKVFDHWHYINIPYNPEGVARLPVVDDDNLITALQSLGKTLASERAGDFEKAFALRMVLHLVGDIHQPFHAVGKVSHAHPEGDLGGNLTLVSGLEGMRNIHMLWDSTAGLLPSVRSEAWPGPIPDFAARLRQQYPLNSFQHSMAFDPEVWARESYQLAVRYGYSSLPADGQLSPDYLRQVQSICSQQLALGGYRLAALLNEVLVQPPARP
ncbi:MAG: S1/P1 nuclease [Candidatus Sericytochromatia bacterium]|nr:S1/P1 nuclease [Candidatus Sericytochromatia bacterium]